MHYLGTSQDSGVSKSYLTLSSVGPARSLTAIRSRGPRHAGAETRNRPVSIGPSRISKWLVLFRYPYGPWLDVFSAVGSVNGAQRPSTSFSPRPLLPFFEKLGLPLIALNELKRTWSMSKRPFSGAAARSYFSVASLQSRRVSPAFSRDCFGFQPVLFSCPLPGRSHLG